MVKKNQVAKQIRWPQILAWSLVLVVMQCCAMLLLARLKDGQLFLLAIPGDAPASVMEISEAARSAKQYEWPALIVIGLIWALLAIASDRDHSKIKTWRDYQTILWRHRWIAGLFLLGALADIATTIAFFHRDGVDQELHPGIRLVSYALGRSIGPVVAKLIQFVGVLIIAGLSRRAAPSVIGAAGMLYLIGAI
jgi:hypothetical protein